jgi:hypothetical protein
LAADKYYRNQQLRSIHSSYISTLASYDGHLVDQIMAIFNAYSSRRFFSYESLSIVLGKPENYLSSLKYKMENSRRLDYGTLFRFLTYIHMHSSNDLIQEKCRDAVFNEMERRHMITATSRELFDLVVFSLATITKAKRAQGVHPSRVRKYDVYDITDLSVAISLKNHPRYFSNKFKYNRRLLGAQGIRLMNELRRNYFYTPDEIGETINRVKLHIKSSHWRKYHLQSYEIYTVQKKQLVDITLGMDVVGFELNKRLKKTKGFFPVSIFTRHHIDYHQAYILLIALDNDAEGEISGYRFKVVPMLYDSHSAFHNEYDAWKGDEFWRQATLIDARMKHLFELRNEGYTAGRDYLKEFRGREIDLDGKKVKIWNVKDEDGNTIFTDEVLEEWIERWKDYETMGEAGWYNKYYKDFYNQEYIAEMDDLRLYLLQDPNCKKPEVWHWFITQYLPETSDIYSHILRFL